MWVNKTEGPTLAWCAQGELTNFYYDFSGKNKWRDCESMLLFPVLFNFQCHRRTDYCKFQYFLAAVSSRSQTGSEHRTASNDFILLWFAIKLYLLMLYDQKSIKNCWDKISCTHIQGRYMFFWYIALCWISFVCVCLWLTQRI